MKHPVHNFFYENISMKAALILYNMCILYEMSHNDQMANKLSVIVILIITV